jgi:myo-inositol-1(or 4)-monophosphatase
MRRARPVKSRCAISVKAQKPGSSLGNSPVTEADLAIDTMLHTELRKAFPAFGWLSEEIEDDGSRLSGAPTFIVDPIDGTRGFMAGGDDWAVSIALVHGGAPVQGVLFNPATGDLLVAEAGKGVQLENAEGNSLNLSPTGKDDLQDALLAFPGPSKASHPFRKHPKIASLALRIAMWPTASLMAAWPAPMPSIGILPRPTSLCVRPA